MRFGVSVELVRRGAPASLWLCAAILLGPAAARAAAPPHITAGPTVTGVAQQGATLTASATAMGDPAPTIVWTWLRCEDPKKQCATIAGASAATYVPTAADVGHPLRVRLTLNQAGGKREEKRSEPTDAVLAAPAPAPVPPPPAPAPAPPPFDLPPAPAPPPSGHPQPAPRVLRPFPLIRIRGRLTVRGARITLLSVRAPRGARIGAACHGSSCPVSRLARTAAAISRLRPFERELWAGTRLTFTVTRRGYIGKWTEIVIRRGAPPKRRDGCLDSDTRRHRRCPAA
jgi:hypothetical protein